MTDPQSPPPNPFGPAPASQPIPPQQPVPPAATAPAPAATGVSGMAADPSTLAATGLIAAVLFAVAAGFFSFLAEPVVDGFRYRLLQLTDTVDVGDVALLGVATALLLLTPDPPGGVARPVLLQITAALAAVISVYAVIRSLTIMSDDGPAFALRFGGFVSIVGVGIAAATIAFYAAKESFLKKEGKI